MVGLDDDLRDDAKYERVLFLRLLVIVAIVAGAVVARSLLL